MIIYIYVDFKERNKLQSAMSASYTHVDVCAAGREPLLFCLFQNTYHSLNAVLCDFGIMCLGKCGMPVKRENFVKVFL